MVLVSDDGALYDCAMSYFSHSWLPFLYQYGLGGIIFIFGIVLTLKAGSFSPKTNAKHKKWLSILILGFVWYLVMHGAWILAALGHEGWATAGGVVVMVLAVIATWLTLHRSRGVV